MPVSGMVGGMILKAVSSGIEVGKGDLSFVPYPVPLVIETFQAIGMLVLPRILVAQGRERQASDFSS